MHIVTGIGCCARYCKRKTNINTSEFGVRKGLLTEKAQLKKMEELILKSILRELKIQASYVSREEKVGEAKKSGLKRDPRKSRKFLNCFVPGCSVDPLVISVQLCRGSFMEISPLFLRKGLLKPPAEFL